MLSLDRYEARHPILRLITGETDAGWVRCIVAALAYYLAWPAAYWTLGVFATKDASMDARAARAVVVMAFFAFLVAAPSWIVSRHNAEPEGRPALGAGTGAGCAVGVLLILALPAFCASGMTRSDEEFVSDSLRILGMILLIGGLFNFLALWAANRYLDRFGGAAT